MSHKLIVFMHSSAETFNGAILRQVTGIFDEQQVSYDVRMLHELSFDPVLSLEDYQNSLEGHYSAFMEQEHEYWRKADEIIVLFPLWWGFFPALGKGYLDQVLSYGFAYELEGESPIAAALKDKQMSIILTSGSPYEEMKANGLHDQLIDTIDRTIIQFCGMTMNRVVHLGDVIQANDQEKQAMFRQVRETFSK
ncbi:NAD(P)H-dependent oxidoreductase [Salisediminibacterium selenitireducens]|uniref:NAD(P)H dehydrogenase (Quinone) n=1 Tax=Bacillus selenitireducens (strain ATCC 700615 / DSM 15326 / MLS10) TaxID=439292 RepID=D6XT74_BACIE|nr:NAD(P)H-dependent oxidoreductase [Salisediminibacterium selenitireducens]ADH99010.1 NAD(P)H dehydrogenase (quinone) [[Bacillus] selenitireducens MLS10]